MPRFVILEHDWPELHWDLLLEAGPVLKAWRLLAEPGPGRAVPAEPNFDHRPMYLDYEGPLSGDRGTVVRWDAGTYDALPAGDVWAVRLNGEKIRGVVRLEREGEGWNVVFGPSSERSSV